MPEIKSDFDYYYEGDGGELWPALVLPGPSATNADLLVFDPDTGAPTVRNNVPYRAEGGGHTFKAV
jgi:hypothetical protein